MANQLVTIDSEDGLFRYVFTFYLDDMNMKFKLNMYQEQERKTKRHHFKNVKIWNRLDHRNSNCQRPFVAEHIQERAKQLFVDRIKFEE